MTIYDLMYTTTVQADAVIVSTHNYRTGETIRLATLYSVDDLVGEEDLFEYEDLEVTYIWVDDCKNLHLDVDFEQYEEHRILGELDAAEGDDTDEEEEEEE